jgi:CDP-diacylglycerol--serine O-phosphatidyltransferase
VLFAVWYVASDVLPATLLALKLGLDAILLVQFLKGVASTESRVRTSLHYAALGAALCATRGWFAPLFTPELVAALVWLCVGFSALVVLNNLGLFKRRFIADLLSLMNLGCGLLSIKLASMGRYDFCVVCLLAGALFDGFDGAAARRWGGTRMGVYSDDLADAVNYGVAPGFALYFAISGWDGAVVGLLYTGFTLARLVYFTVAKSGSDPSRFQGAPSTLGGLTVLCGLGLFERSPLHVGLLVGAACILMVSFATSYRHAGRWLAAHPGALKAAPAVLVLLVGGYPLLGAAWPLACLLSGSMAYGLWPVVSAFRAVQRSKRRTTAAPGLPG